MKAGCTQRQLATHALSVAPEPSVLKLCYVPWNVQCVNGVAQLAVQASCVKFILSLPLAEIPPMACDVADRFPMAAPHKQAAPACATQNSLERNSQLQKPATTVLG